MFDFWCFNLYLKTYGLNHFLDRFVVFNKNFLVPLDYLLGSQYCEQQNNE